MKEMDMIKDIVRVYRNYPDHVAFVIDDTSYTYQEVFARVQGIMPFRAGLPGRHYRNHRGRLHRNVRLYSGRFVIRENLRNPPSQLPGQSEQNHCGIHRNETGIIRSRIRYAARPLQRDQMYFNIRATG